MFLKNISHKTELLEKYGNLYWLFWDSPSNYAQEINNLLPPNLENGLNSESFALYWIHFCMEDKESLEKFNRLNWTGHNDIKQLLLRTSYALGLAEEYCRAVFEQNDFLKSSFDEYQSEFLISIKDLVKSKNGEFKSAVELT